MRSVPFLRQQVGVSFVGLRKCFRPSHAVFRHGIIVAHSTATVKTIRTIAFILIILGAIYWALIGLLQIDALAALIDGPTSTVSRIVYALIGIAGLIAVVIVFAGDGSLRPL